MNLTRRSLEFSLILHGFLVSVGIICFYLASRSWVTGVTSPSEPEMMRVTVVKLAPNEPPPPPSPPAAQAQVRIPVVPSRRPPAKGSASPSMEVPSPIRLSSEPRVAGTSGTPSGVVAEVAPSYPKASPRSTEGAATSISTQRPSKRPTQSPGAPLWSPPATSPSPSPPVGSSSNGGTQTEQSVAARPDRFVKLKDVAAVTILQAASVEARFEIAADGSTTVSLLKGTGIADVDAKIVEFLATVHWTPKTVGGVPVADVVIMDLDTEG